MQRFNKNETVCTSGVQNLHAAISFSSQGQGQRSHMPTSVQLIQPSVIYYLLKLHQNLGAASPHGH